MLTIPRSPRAALRRHVKTRSRGQSLVEFALILPVTLFLLMMGLDFGRVFLGWINLNNTARIAANFAAANASKMAANDSATFDSYYAAILKDAAAINCTLPDKASFPHPTFPAGTGLGQSANVGISCQFGIITPFISRILGSPITVSASSDFPIRTGAVSGVPAGGPVPPVAAFNVSPTGGTSPIAITFSDVSTSSPTQYAWDFDGNGVVDSILKTPPPFTFTIPGTYQASLTVSNGIVFSTAIRTIIILAPPGPVANFTATPQTGPAPLSVTFVDTSTSTLPIASRAWDFGNGTTATTAGPFTKSYATANTYTATLTVTDSLGQTSTASKVITATSASCTVPNFKNVTTSSSIQTTWTAAGFSSTVVFSPARPPEYKITKQSLAAGSSQACTATFTVFN
jgi:PKD repeat protein